MAGPRPLLVYMGSKSRTTSAILPLLPPHDHRQWYFEPFCGTAAVALAYNHPNTVLGDLNKDLMRVHVMTRQRPDAVWHEYRRLARYWAGRSPAGRGLTYVQLLKEHNAQEAEAHAAYQQEMEVGDLDEAHDVGVLYWSNPIAAARLLFLTRHAWRGALKRHASGVGYQACTPDLSKGLLTGDLVGLEARHRAISAALRQPGWGLYCTPYQVTLRDVQPGDVVFLDPPYPGQYSDTTVPHADVARLMHMLHNRRAIVVLTTNNRVGLEEFGCQPLSAVYRVGRGTAVSTRREHWLITNSPNARSIPRQLGPAPAPAEPADAATERGECSVAERGPAVAAA